MPILWFIHARGCPACAALRPEVGRWLRANPGRVRPLALDLEQVEWKAKRWEPELTPTLLLVDEGRVVAKMEGFEELTDFARWIEGALGALAPGALR